jgi:DNA invertase Pin-like site-specific DNA recombinase
MKDKIEVVPYFRKNKIEAVIYVRGHNKEFQEMMCRLYAADKGYEVVYVTKHLKDVNLCDVLLVTDPSRISRDQLEYYKIVNELKEKGIEVVSIANQRDIEESNALARRLYKELNNK